ncbi:AraC family transcriptional regulator [uncultured Shewanella sp.]|uniref:AraC family transcriptional regulator n=1 Tax=uncultured Shewanella sp. TaxID=173975 RepID=UPI002638FBCC|nr:AraC family transcriptional regulator [uncultured Shewanella sp.]
MITIHNKAKITKHRQQGYYIVSPTLKILLNLLGADETLVLKHAKLPSDLFSHTEARLSHLDYFQLWQGIETVFSDQPFPLLVAKHMSTDFFDPPFFAAYCSPNLHTALERLSRFKPLLCPMTLTFTETQQHFSVHIGHLQAVEAIPNMMTIMDMVFILQLARMATREHIIPYRISGPSPSLIQAEYKDFFACPVQQSASMSITFDKKDIYKPFVSDNPRMWSFFEPELRKRLIDITTNIDMQTQVRYQLLEMLPSGQTTIQALAQRIYISPRTIQRRLSAEGTYFKAILAEVRKQLAHHYLTQSSIPYSQIALLLGYQDTSSFFRAFHQWSGITPETQRNQNETDNKKDL